MQRIEATLRVVTPMFIGDAEQKASSLRPPSIKGALRFWWRALNWARLLAEAQDDVPTALKQLHADEAQLFGLAAAEDNNRQQRGGQGCFLLRVHQPSAWGPLVTDWPTNNTGSGYLGYGLFATNQQPHREGIREGQTFTVELSFKPNTTLTQIDSVREALRAWGLLGGLGSRARRGFGSVSLLTLNGETQTLHQADYLAAIRALLNDAATVRAFPPYTAFSGHADFSLLATDPKNARQAHNQAGLLYKQHRGQASDLRGEAKIPFGLPLAKADEKNRRASPLLFHVQELADGSFLAGVLYLPAQFHHASRYEPHNRDLEYFYRQVARFLRAGEVQA